MSEYLKGFLRFVALVLVQVLLLNKIGLQWWTSVSGYTVFLPYIYPLFILLLPYETPVWLLLFLGMAMGLTIDTFMNTAGMHAAATVLMAYLRTNVLLALLPKHLSEYGTQSPNVRNMSWAPFLTYAAFLFVIHHSVYFMLQFWSIQHLGRIGLTILASTFTSLLMVVAYLLLATRGPKRA